MNFVEIAGHLGADAEERFTSSGKRIIMLRLATRARKDKTIWWRVNIWDNRFDKMLPYLKKGTALIVFGEMSEPEIYQNKEGKSQISLTVSADVVRFSPFGKGTKEGGVEAKSQKPSHNKPEEEEALLGAAAHDDSGFTGDDLPF